ncbi:MAG: hypothetical protein AAFP88_00065 [Bacteroidota bacterium]
MFKDSITYLVTLVASGLFLILATACESNEDGATVGRDQGSELTGNFIAWKGKPLTEKYRDELIQKGLNPSDYQLHNVAPDGDCEQRVAMLNLLIEVLIDQTPPFDEFAARVRNCAATYTAADPRFTQYAQIEEVLEAIQRLKGKSLKEILVWMNGAKIDRLLIGHFSRPMLAAGSFLAGREALNKLLARTNLTKNFEGKDITSEETLKEIEERVNLFIEALEKESTQNQRTIKEFLKGLISRINVRYVNKESDFALGKNIVAQYLYICKTAINGSRYFYQAKNYGFDLVGSMVTYKDKYHIMAYKNINDELVTPSIPSRVPILVPTGNSIHVNVLIRKDALQEKNKILTQVAPIN